MPGDDDGQRILVHSLLQSRPELLHVLGIDHIDVVDAAGPAEVLQDEFLRGLVADGQAGGRVLLAAGHGGGGVVEDDDHALGLVIGGVDQAGDAGVDESRIAQDADDALARCALRQPSWKVTPAPMHTHECSADIGGKAGQRVAADVARDVGVQLLQGRERSPVRALGAQAGLAFDRLLLHLDLARHDVRNQFRRQLADAEGRVLGGDLDAQGPDVVLDEGVQFLHDNELLDALGELADLVVAERIAHSELQVRGVRVILFQVLVARRRT